MRVCDAERQRELNDWRELVETEAGVRVVRQLLETSLLFAPTYSAQCQYATAYNEGLRRMGLFLWEHIQEAAPHKLTELIQHKGDTHGRNGREEERV